MHAGWSKIADHFEQHRYGVSRRSFFMPGTECQALCLSVGTDSPSSDYGKRPQSASAYVDVPGTVSVECLAPVSQHTGGD